VKQLYRHLIAVVHELVLKIIRELLQRWLDHRWYGSSDLLLCRIAAAAKSALLLWLVSLATSALVVASEGRCNIWCHHWWLLLWLLPELLVGRQWVTNHTPTPMTAATVTPPLTTDHRTGLKRCGLLLFYGWLLCHRARHCDCHRDCCCVAAAATALPGAILWIRYWI
jgi:hypothetical protein